jgi:triosephosphate isomerase
MKKLIVANWKCNPVSLNEAQNIFEGIKKGTLGSENEVVICPPFVYLPLLKGITIGAQDVFFEEKGAFTGEISASMLKNFNCSYVIIGHSERRRMFGDNNENVFKKVKAVLKERMTPILCVDNLSQLDGIEVDFKDIVVAFEPISAIGTGQPLSFEEAAKAKNEIENVVGKETRILYGGSVNSSNSANYIKAGFDGLLIGGASLKPDEFSKIVESVF